ncbi:putative S-layer protein [Candidatus Pacearchaeota archaeon]|nr:putative S-layer protein [Candidatus Pacearchaeota archaeon]
MSVGKTYSAILKVMDNNNEQQNVTASFERSFCDYGENGSSIEINSVEDDDDFEWNPLDDVTIEVEVENNGNSREKVTVELGLYSVSDNEFVEIDGNDDILEQSIRIDDDDEEVFTFEFKVSPELAEGDYRLYVKAYLDSDEAAACDSKIGSSLYEAVEIDYDDEEVIIDDIQAPIESSCGFVERVSMDVYNLDYGDDEDFRVNLYNQELGIDMNSDIFTLDNGDSETVEFDFKLPSNAVAKPYKILARVQYNYKSKSDTFFDETRDYYFTLTVKNCQSASGVVTAELSEDTPNAIIGSQVVIEATIKNTGTNAATYNMQVTGNSAWSQVAEIDPETFTLNAGESKKAKIYLDIDSEAEAGDKEFTITATYNGVSVNQKVLLTLEEGFNTSKLWNHLKAYWFLYLIGAITLLLLIIVIVLLVRRSED